MEKKLQLDKATIAVLNTREMSKVVGQGGSPICPDPDPGYPVFFPDDDDCAVFYECNNGQAYTRRCPDILLWNQNLQTCDYPYNVTCPSSRKARTI